MSGYATDNRRFSDIAPGLNIDVGDVYLHDVYGACLKAINLMSKGVAFSNVDNFIGKRNNAGVENSLVNDVRETLVSLISEASFKIEKVRLVTGTSSQINSEKIWVSIMNDLMESKAKKECEQMITISPEDFNRITLVVMKKVWIEHYRIKMSY